MSECDCRDDCCLEIIPVTVTSENIQYNGANAGWHQEVFAGSAGTSFTLASYPVDDGSVKVYLNGVLQRQGTDYIIAGSIISFTSLNAADVIAAVYFSYDAEIEKGNVPIGGIIWSASSAAPSGYSAADGATSITIADYPALYTFCAANALVDSSTALAFVMVDLGQTINAIVLYAFIKN